MIEISKQEVEKISKALLALLVVIAVFLCLELRVLQKSTDILGEEFQLQT